MRRFVAADIPVVSVMLQQKRGSSPSPVFVGEALPAPLKSQTLTLKRWDQWIWTRLSPTRNAPLPPPPTSTRLKMKKRVFSVNRAR
ncbi:hypothetical protein PSAC2689_90249 [Paraburkholderia sacchari]